MSTICWSRTQQQYHRCSLYKLKVFVQRLLFGMGIKWAVVHWATECTLLDIISIAHKGFFKYEQGEYQATGTMPLIVCNHPTHCALCICKCHMQTYHVWYLKVAFTGCGCAQNTKQYHGRMKAFQVHSTFLHSPHLDYSTDSSRNSYH